MIFWVFAITITAVALYAIAKPLRRRVDDGASTADYDVAVFKSQLREIDRDLERGRVNAEEAEASRVEIGRRLLAADKRRETATAAGRRAGPIAKVIAAAIIAGGVTAGTVVYSRMGDPSNPDMPLVLRQAERVLAEGGGAGAASSPETAQAGSLDRAANQLRARLAAGEGGPEDWSLLGRTEMMRGEYAAAASAYQEALKTFPDDPELIAAYGESLVLWAGGTVTENAFLAFQRVAQLAPLDARARFYLAEFERQEGRFKNALDAWIVMLRSAPEGASWVPMVRERAEELADQMGVDLSERLASPPAVAPGPTSDDIAAAREMTEEDRQAMIRGMVEGLADRLAQDPSDFDGWTRLIRSRVMLGEIDAAQRDLNQAAGLFAAGPVPTRALADLAGELGLAMPGTAAETASTEDAGPRGPSAEDIAAAQDMEEGDRDAMIAGMVDQLAARLEDEPDDLEGWKMLGRSYAVLERGEDAVSALTRASELAPEDPTLLIERARIMRVLAGNQQTAETIALMAQVAEMDPDNTEALWFLGLSELRAGERAAARELMDRAVATIPESAPERTTLQLQLERLFAE